MLSISLTTASDKEEPVTMDAEINVADTRLRARAFAAAAAEKHAPGPCWNPDHGELGEAVAATKALQRAARRHPKG